MKAQSRREQRRVHHDRRTTRTATDFLWTSNVSEFRVSFRCEGLVGGYVCAERRRHLATRIDGPSGWQSFDVKSRADMGKSGGWLQVDL